MADGWMEWMDRTGMDGLDRGGESASVDVTGALSSVCVRVYVHYLGSFGWLTAAQR